MHQILSRLYAWRRKMAWLALALCAGLAVAASQVRIDNSLETWFVHDDPAYLRYREFLAAFGNDELVVTAIHADSPRLDAARLQRLAALTTTLQDIDGVDRVRSLANARVRDGLHADAARDPMARAQAALALGALPSR